MKWWSGLRPRLLAVVLFAVVPAIALLLYTAEEQRQVATRRVQQDMLNLAQNIAAQHEQVIEGTRQLLVALAQAPMVRELDLLGCPAMFSRLLERFPSYTNLGVATVAGDLVCSAVPASSRVNVADRAYFQRALATRDFAIGDYQIGRITGKPTVGFGYPVMSEAGRVQAVVFGALDLTWLERRVAQFSLPPGTAVLVLAHDGTILARHPNEGAGIGQSLAHVPEIRTILAQRRGVTEGVGLDATHRLFAFSPLGEQWAGRGPCVAVAVRKAAALLDVERTLRFHLLGLGLLGAVVLGAAWVGSDVFVLRRVRALVAAAQRLGRGDLSARVAPPYGRGELGDLASAFNEAAIAIERLTSHNALILESIGEGICGLDRKGRITFVNPATTSLTGFSAEELIGQSMHAALHHSRADKTPYLPEACPTSHTLRHGVTRYIHEEVFWRKDGSSFPVDWISAPIREQGEVIGAVVAFRDITERRQAEQELQRQREALHQSEKVATMGSLLAGVAHELNNPLAVVMGQATLLKQAVKEGPLAQRGEKIVAAGQRCARIIRNFLALARKQAPERGEMHLNAVVHEAVELLGYQLRTENVEIILNLADGLPAIWADTHRIHQVLVNLITNAFHAMRQIPGLRRLTITTRSLEGNTRVRMEVADTGPGMPPEIQARIFEPFFTTKPAGEGTGLGLSLCRGIIEEHEGTLAVRSEVGQGAAFVIELPVSAPKSGGPETERVEGGRTVPPKTVLVIDDEPEVVGVLVDMLTQDGHRVDTALNGAVALDMLGQRSYDIVICDVKMPVLDGIGFFQEAERRFGPLRHRLIFLTGDTLGRNRLASLESDGLPVLTKPFDVDDVERAIHRVVVGTSR